VAQVSACAFFDLMKIKTAQAETWATWLAALTPIMQAMGTEFSLHLRSGEPFRQDDFRIYL
jgi:hypothetical protein